MMSEQESLRPLHKALLNLNKRAERAANEILVSNFVDSEPLFDLLSTPNNQVLYGRRGTGKTHALKYLGDKVQTDGEVAIYLDLRSIGSNTSIYADGSRSVEDRASALIADMLNALYDEFYSLAVVALDKAPDARQLTLRLDDLGQAISAIKIKGSIEEEKQEEQSSATDNKSALKVVASKSPSIEFGASAAKKADTHNSTRATRSGTEIVYLDFGNITATIGGLMEMLNVGRVWLLIDE
jgi:Cdc6-like AAA superfamily ATPase